MTVGADLPLVVQTGTDTRPASLVLGADSVRADTFLPVFVERVPLEAAGEIRCMSLLCQMDPATDLVLLTSYVMACVVSMMSAPKLVVLLREIAWEIFDLLAHRR